MKYVLMIFVTIVLVILTATSTWLAHDLVAPPPACVCDSSIKLNNVMIDGHRGEMVLWGCEAEWSPWALEPLDGGT